MALVKSFGEYFEIVAARSQQQRDQVYRIRYEVYAEELGWEDREQFPAGMEKDRYDDHASHCLLKHKPSNTYVGCVRLVAGDSTGAGELLPIEKTFNSNFVDSHPLLKSHARDRVGEISRIAVVSSFRHRRGERNKPDTEVEDPNESGTDERRRFPHIALGLYLAAGAMGIAQGKTCVFAMMEPKLARRLRIFGIKFEQLADAINHRGSRAPFIVTRENFCGGFAPPMAALLDHISSAIEN